MEEEPTLPTEDAPQTEELREKRKRATAAIDFDKLSNGEAEDPAPGADLPGEPPTKKAEPTQGWSTFQTTTSCKQSRCYMCSVLPSQM